jgi:hypothetical protein
MSIPVLVAMDIMMILTVVLKKYASKVETFIGPIFFFFCCVKCLASLLLFGVKRVTQADFLVMNVVLWAEYNIIC